MKAKLTLENYISAKLSSDYTISSVLSNPNPIKATLIDENYILKAGLSKSENLTGKLSSDKALTGTISTDILPNPYDGEYEVIPKTVSQGLETRHKYMKKNVTVLEIPYAETSNVYGTTVVIAS